jgi:hypothetical protein
VRNYSFEKHVLKVDEQKLENFKNSNIIAYTSLGMLYS